MQATEYRERIAVPGWVVPAVGVLSGLWVARRLRGLTGGRSGIRKLLSLLNAISTAATLIGLVRRFGYVAVEVEDRFIHLGFGPIERKIDARNVRDVRIVPYNPLQFLGWGYRIGGNGRRAFSQIGVRRGVEVTVDEAGRQRRYFISSNEPEALASAIAAVAGAGVAA